MTEGEPRVEFEKLREYSFDEGIEEVISDIELLLQNQKKIAVGINGSGAHVGKTTFGRVLKNRLMEKEIISVRYNNPDDRGRNAGEGWRVLIVEQAGINLTADPNNFSRVRELIDRDLSVGIGEELEIEKYDIIVAIYRVDKPFDTKNNYKPISDIIVRNDNATNK